jgi:ribosomal subunit interface protein
MNVIVRSRHTRISPRLRTVAERKLHRLGRLTPDAARAEVDFNEEHNPRIVGRHRCAVTLHLRRGLITAHAAAPQPEAALDLVLGKVRHQVGRLKDQRVPRAPAVRRSRRRS